MAARKNDYKFDQNSPSGHPGFESFKSPEDQLYYFHFNDKAGQPLLYSPGFSTAKERTALRNKARKALPQRSTLKKYGNRKAYYFTLSTSSGEEIARSADFSKREARDTAFETLLSSLSDSPNTLETGKQAAKTKPSDLAAKLALPESQQSVLPTRFRYNLIFRRMEDGQPLVGEMEYPILKERITFQGVDENAIMTFIMEHLPQGAGERRGRHKEMLQLEKEMTQKAKLLEELRTELAEIQAEKTAVTNAQQTEIARITEQAKNREADLLHKLEKTKADSQQSKEATQTELKTLNQQLAEQRNQLDDALSEKEELQTKLTRLQTKQETTEPSTSEDAVNDEILQTAARAKRRTLQSLQKDKVQKTVALLADGNTTGRTVNLKSIKSTSLQMTIQQLAEQNALESFRADVYIKSLEDNRRLALVKNHYGTLGLDNQNLTVPVALHTLSPGTYRLNLSVSSVQPPFNMSSPKYEGNTIVQVV